MIKMVFQKGHKPYPRKDKVEDTKMFGKKNNKENVKTFVDGQEINNAQPQAPIEQPVSEPPAELPELPPTEQPTQVGKYVEAGMKLVKLPATILLKIEVSGDIIPVIIKIDGYGEVTG